MRLKSSPSFRSPLDFARAFLEFVAENHVPLEIIALVTLATTILCFIVGGPRATATVVMGSAHALDDVLLVAKAACKFMVAVHAAIADPLEVKRKHKHRESKRS